MEGAVDGGHRWNSKQDTHILLRHNLYPRFKLKSQATTPPFAECRVRDVREITLRHAARRCLRSVVYKSIADVPIVYVSRDARAVTAAEARWA